MKVSVALAAYNGEKYINEQLQSILVQLNVGDEIIFSDDGSRDKTLEVISCIDSEQISLCKNLRKGVITNFENAIHHTSGDIIFLCDQDDVWARNKIEVIQHYFKTTDADLIISDAYVTDENLNIVHPSFYELMNSGGGIMKNFMKNTYLGCCMTFRSHLKDVILPFPEKIPMHDSWIGLLAELKGKVLFIPEKLVYYRRHGGNATVLKRNSLRQSLLWRKNLFLELVKRQREISRRDSSR
jgi:glycosyltransferase involved in cell wall biosynthesis